MKVICICLFCLVFWSCKHTNVISNNVVDSTTIKLHEGHWYSNFKNEVFIRCLKKIYPESFKKLIDSLDASTSANIDQLDNNLLLLSVADSLANNFAKRPEASWTIENAKVTLNVCIGYRNSSELDSVAVFLYRKYYLNYNK